MKRLILLSISLFAFSLSFAQTDIGVKGGLTFSNWDVPAIGATDSRTSFNLGLAAEQSISDNIGLRAELLYTGSGFDSAGGSTVDQESSNLILPVVVKASFDLGATSLASIGAGLQPGIVLDDDDAAALKTFELALPIQAGIRLDSGFFADATYRLGLTDVLENTLGGDIYFFNQF